MAAASAWRREELLSGTSRLKLVLLNAVKGFSYEMERREGWSWERQLASEGSF